MLLCTPPPQPIPQKTNQLTPTPVCPSCSNTLIITRVPAHQLPPSSAQNANHHHFSCRTCPYQMPLDRAYYERRHFAATQPDDVLGGAGVWEDVDRTPGM